MKKILNLIILLLIFCSNVFGFAQYSISPESINKPNYFYILDNIKDYKDYNYFEISDLSNLDYSIKYDYTINSSKKIDFNGFEINEIKNKNTADIKYVLSDKDNNIIGIEEKILDIKIDDNILMLVVGGIHQLRVEYVYLLPNTPMFSISYIIPVTISQNMNLNIVSAKILSDNYINCKYNIGREEIWRCKNTEDVFKKNHKLKEEKAYKTKLIWANDLNSFLKSIDLKSYDFIEQDEEPTIEQLKEKFPNDTFFSEPEAEQKIINNATESINPSLWQKITFWCRNIISKFTV